MIAVTGANGHLGQLVIEGLVERVPANQIVAAVRSPEKAFSFKTLGVHDNAFRRGTEPQFVGRVSTRPHPDYERLPMLRVWSGYMLLRVRLCG